jgi:hypothetical protein
LRSSAVLKQASALSGCPRRLCSRPIMKCTADSRGTISCRHSRQGGQGEQERKNVQVVGEEAGR